VSAGGLTLDHAGAIVRDLRGGADRWIKLGFTLSPETRQRGKMLGRDDDSPWGTANRCAIFRQGYLEIIGVVDPRGYNPWTRFLDRFEGLHLCALRTLSADAAYSMLSARNKTFQPPISRERKIDIDGREESIRFRNIFSRDELCPEGRWIVIEHCTPELLWQDRYLEHANGAKALEEVTLVGSGDLIERITSFAPLTVTVSSPDEFLKLYGWLPPSLPAFGSVTVRFADREVAATLMEASGAKVRRMQQGWFVGPEDSGGFVLKLT
jgi:hypothetical protein